MLGDLFSFSFLESCARSMLNCCIGRIEGFRQYIAKVLNGPPKLLGKSKEAQFPSSSSCPLGDFRANDRALWVVLGDAFMLAFKAELPVDLIGNNNEIVLTGNLGQLLKFFWLVCEPCWVIRVADNEILVFAFWITDIFLADFIQF